MNLRRGCVVCLSSVVLMMSGHHSRIVLIDGGVKDAEVASVKPDFKQVVHDDFHLSNDMVIPGEQVRGVREFDDYAVVRVSVMRREPDFMYPPSNDLFIFEEGDGEPYRRISKMSLFMSKGEMRYSRRQGVKDKNIVYKICYDDCPSHPIWKPNAWRDDHRRMEKTVARSGR